MDGFTACPAPACPPPQLRIRQALLNTVATGCYGALTRATGLIGDASRSNLRLHKRPPRSVVLTLRPPLQQDVPLRWEKNHFFGASPKGEVPSSKGKTDTACRQ